MAAHEKLKERVPDAAADFDPLLGSPKWVHSRGGTLTGAKGEGRGVSAETAKRFDQISYMDVLTKDLRVMDATAISLARENEIPIIIFNVRQEGNFAQVMTGKGTFTTVSSK